MRFFAGYPPLVAGALALLLGAPAPGVGAEPMPARTPAGSAAAHADRAYRAGLDSRGRTVSPADLPAPASGRRVGPGRIVIPVRPPAGPPDVELELELPPRPR
ncbi:MAG TPA: hypothetical protein VFZ01_15840 [Geminicoccaceae bacterium]